MRKHILPLLLCLIMVMSFMPATTLAADPDIAYIGEDGTTHYVSASDVTEVTSDMSTNWNEAWYVVSGSDVTIGGPVMATTNTNLILADNAKLTVTGIINCIGNLTIYAQSASAGMGKLVVSTSSGNAIVVSGNTAKIVGGDVDITTTGSGTSGIYSVGSIAISGGDVDIKVSSANAHGISSTGDVTITGEAKVNIESTYAGIYSAGQIAISGGDVDTKVSSTDAHGIYSTGGVTISGGDVDIKASGTNAYGISSTGGITITDNAKVNIESNSLGILSNHCNVTISGGTLDITNTGIGASGICNIGGNIAISGGTVDIETSGTSAHGIIGGNAFTISGGTVDIETSGESAYGISTYGITISGGDVDIASAEVYGISTGNAAISGGTVTVTGGTGAIYSTNTDILAGDYLTPTNRSVKVNTTNTAAGAVSWYGTPALNLDTLKYVRIAPLLNIPYLDAAGQLKTAQGVTAITDTTTELSEAWCVVSGTDVINSQVTLTTNTNLILADGKTLTVNGGIACGNFTLTIYAQSTSTDMGKLVVSASSGGAVISSGSGDINIFGGVASVTSSGATVSAIRSSAGSIQIANANVTAESYQADGISAENGSVTIENSKVTITANDNVDSDGIHADSVTISAKSNVTASGGDCGIYAKGSATFTDSTIKATASKYPGVGNGITFGETASSRLTVIGGNVVADGNGNGIYAAASTSVLCVSDGTFIATGNGGRAILSENITNPVVFGGAYLNPANRSVMVKTTITATDATSWDEKTALTSAEYLYVRIAPPAPAPTPSAMPTHGTPIYYWSSLNPQPETTPTLPDVDTLITATPTPAAIPSATPVAAPEAPPQTGDSFTAVGFIMAAIALAAIAFAAVKRRNRQTH